MRLPAFVVASLVTTTAYAQRVGVVVTGEATVQPQVAAQLERWLHEKGREVVPGPLEPEAINTLIDCFVLEDLGCARGVVDTRSKSKAVVFTRAETTQNSDGTRDIAISGYWFQKNRDVVAERRVCAKCNDDTLHATVDELMLALVHDPPVPVPGESQPIAAEEPSEEKSSLPRWAPLGIMAAGGIAVVAGGVMIAIDEDPNPNGAQAPEYRNTATGGAVLLVSGALAAGVGYYLWRRQERSMPVAAVTGDGGYVGWLGRF
jgi:hypothetical protein